MKSLTIDFTTDYYAKNKEDDGFSGVGFGNIMCIIGLSLSYIKDQTTPIYIKIDKNVCEKTYNDTLNIINNLQFGNFQISLLDDSINNLIEIDDVLKVNDNSDNNYVIRKRNMKNCHGFYHAKTYGICKNLHIIFKNPLKIENIIKQDDEKIFNLIQSDFIVINIRRNEKLKLDNYLIIDESICENIIKNSVTQKILFISDDIQWCKQCFSKYSNVYFYNSHTFEKPIIDQFILHKAKYFYGNLDCSFSTIPLTISTNKIMMYVFFCKNEEYYNEKTNEFSRFNFFKNSKLCDKMFLLGVEQRKMNDLLFFTSALNEHKNFIVLYSYFAKKFNQNSKFEFLVNNIDEDFKKLIQNFSNDFNIEIKLTHIDYPELNGQVIRFLIKPSIYCTYTYIGDIDIFFNEDILKFHIDQMNKFETIWDNQQRKNEPEKITGLHFVKSKEWYEQTKEIRQKYLNPINFNKTNDEIILKKIIYESNLNQTKYDDTLRERPLHGCHISLNRVPFTDKMSFPCELYKKMFIDDFFKSEDYIKIKKYLSNDMINILNICTNYVLNESSNK